MSRDFSVIDGILQELRDSILALDRLDNSYNLATNKWHDSKYYAEFRERKKQVKEVRDNAWQWLKKNNFQPEQHRELERGNDHRADIPIHWEAEVVRLKSEIEDAKDELRRRDIQAAGQAQLAIAPNLYLIIYPTRKRLVWFLYYRTNDEEKENVDARFACQVCVYELGVLLWHKGGILEFYWHEEIIFGGGFLLAQKHTSATHQRRDGQPNGLA